MPRRLRPIILAIGVVLAAASSPALAQYTGGSMGGGSFSGGGGGGGGGYSGGGYSGGGGYYSSSGGSGCNKGVAWVFVSIFLVYGLVEMVDSFGRKKREVDYSKVDVTGLRLAIDWRARKFVQAELDKIARNADTLTSSGLNAMLRKVALALRRSRESWIYAGFADISPRSPAGAERYFHQLAEDSKARFRAELVRNQDGSMTRADAPEHLRARPEEGPGLVVVTLLVAARGDLGDYGDAADTEEIRGWLEAASAIDTTHLAAVQIIWSPAAEDDRMSSAELEVLYPELSRVRGSTLVGRVYCDYCGGPYPAELQACPHCGGKAAA